jgi:accessory colonization factor AcfC
MKECADIFSQKAGVEVNIAAGTPPQWVEQAKQSGGVIYEGAGYMLNDFMQAYPGIVEEASISGLYARAAAILVRKGNPKGIKALSDLARDGVKVMVVTQEKME